MSQKIPINFRINKKEKELFFHNANNLGIPPSTLLSMFIINFNKSKKITFSLDESIKLEPFSPDKTKNIIDDFKMTKKYNQKFLNDLEKGLKRSRLNKSK